LQEKETDTEVKQTDRRTSKKLLQLPCLKQPKKAIPKRHKTTQTDMQTGRETGRQTDRQTNS